MKKLILFIVMLTTGLQAQSIEFNVSVNNDTLLLGNFLEVKFEVNNGTGKFSGPEFRGWNLVAGPNSASSYSIMNGVVKQSSSYTYYLEAEYEGEYLIESASLKVGDIEYKTPVVKIVVRENPDGIRQHPKFKNEGLELKENNTPAEPQKKRKVIKL